MPKIMSRVKIAVEGCCHGELDSIYKSLREDVELLIICGDFQALRNTTDLKTINVPDKYKRLGDFHDYYKGAKKAPVLTIFIGGNHECSSYLQELRFGGWVAENIYFLGEFGSIWFKGIHIGGISGIYNKWSFLKNETESLPYNTSSLRSVYHVKARSFIKLYLMNTLDIAISHDWPNGIEQFGNVKKLLQKKKFFKDDIRSGKLGSPLGRLLLEHIKPHYWFSAHLHVKFEATVRHKKANNHTDGATDKLKNESKDLNVNNEQLKKRGNTESYDFSKKMKTSSTYFLALDKYRPHRQYLEILDIEPSAECVSSELFYDKRAIAVNRVVEKYIEILDELDLRLLFEPQNLDLMKELNDEVEFEMKNVHDSDLMVPRNFKIVAPTSTESEIPLQYWPSNQTDEFRNKFRV